MNDSRDFHDVESVRSAHSNVTSQTSVFPISSNSWWNVEPFYWNAEPQRRAAKHSVNTIPPDTEIHEQMTMTNGYVKVCTTTSTPSTTVRPLWTIT